MICACQVKQSCEASTLQVVLEGREHSHAHWVTHKNTMKDGKTQKRETHHHHAYANRTILYETDPLLGQAPIRRPPICATSFEGHVCFKGTSTGRSRVSQPAPLSLAVMNTHSQLCCLLASPRACTPLKVAGTAVSTTR